jgi:hypothetical protein
MASTPYQLDFKTPRTDELVCEVALNAEEVRKFRKVCVRGTCVLVV